MFLILSYFIFSFTGYDYGRFDVEPLPLFQFQNPQLFHGYQQGEGFDHLPSKFDNSTNYDQWLINSKNSLPSNLS